MVNYRSIGAPGAAYPQWVRALRGKSGVYAIRVGGELVYVGESHKGKLYETLTRHFQTWRRGKSWWSGWFAPSANDPGVTYDRARARVAVRVHARGADAIAQQDRLIRRLRPRDNKVVPQ